MSAEAFRFCPRCAGPLATRAIPDAGGGVFERLGFTEILYSYEPVGAAFFFARELKEDATVPVDAIYVGSEASA